MPKLRLLDCLRSWLPHLLETGQKSRQELLGSCKTRGREFCLEGTMPPFLLGNFQTWKKKTFNLADKEFSFKTKNFYEAFRLGTSEFSGSDPRGCSLLISGVVESLSASRILSSLSIDSALSGTIMRNLLVQI